MAAERQPPGAPRDHSTEACVKSTCRPVWQRHTRSWIMCALGRQACRDNYSVFYQRVYEPLSGAQILVSFWPFGTFRVRAYQVAFKSKRTLNGRLDRPTQSKMTRYGHPEIWRRVPVLHYVRWARSRHRGWRPEALSLALRRSISQTAQRIFFGAVVGSTAPRSSSDWRDGFCDRSGRYSRKGEN